MLYDMLKGNATYVAKLLQEFHNAYAGYLRASLKPTYYLTFTRSENILSQIIHAEQQLLHEYDGLRYNAIIQEMIHVHSECLRGREGLLEDVAEYVHQSVLEHKTELGGRIEKVRNCSAQPK